MAPWTGNQWIKQTGFPYLFSGSTKPEIVSCWNLMVKFLQMAQVNVTMILAATKKKILSLVIFRFLVTLYIYFFG